MNASFVLYSVLRLAVFFAFAGFVLYLVARHARTQSELLRLHLEARNRLLDRFSTADAFLAFARSDEGRAVLQAPSLPAAAPRLPGLRLFQGGALCLALGGGWLLAGAGAGAGGRESFTVASLILSGGVGLVLSGVLAWFAARAAGRQ